VKKHGNGVEKEAANPCRGWITGRMLMDEAGLRANQEPFYASPSWKPTTLTENKVNQNPLDLIVLRDR